MNHVYFCQGFKKLEILVHVFCATKNMLPNKIVYLSISFTWNVVCARLYIMMCLGAHQLQQYAIISFKINLY